MRIESLSVSDAPPVRRFSVAELSDVVVIAGPNGVGKTRLLQRVLEHLRGGGLSANVAGVIRATRASESAAWGKDSLDLSDATDSQLLTDTLRANRTRHIWRSSVVNIESDRTIRTLRALDFAWDIPDPYNEEIGWETTFGNMSDRYQDTVHSMFRRIKSQRDALGNRALQLRREGKANMRLRFEDPMEPFKQVFRQLLAPKEMADPSGQGNRLTFREDGQEFEMVGSLSSGEREVVNIAFDFLLRQPEDCVVFFDEPELHLHPELSYKLIQTLQTVGRNNQFFLTTHSPDIITASLEHTVVFLAPAEPGEDVNQAVVVSESDETNRALRLLGHSVGIVSLGKRIVLIEGEDSSLDKQTYGAILAAAFPSLVLVPSGGRHVLESFSTVYDRVLARTLWGVEFFMLCDGDSSPGASKTVQRATKSGRLRLLPRYHLENYFLDESVWAEVFKEMEPVGSWLRDPAEIRARFRADAESFASYAAALQVAADVRAAVGNVDIMPSNCQGLTTNELVKLFEATVAAEILRTGKSLEMARIKSRIRKGHAALMRAVQSEGDDWKALVPGKPLLGKFASRANIPVGRAKRLYIQVALARGGIFDDLIELFREFAEA